MNLELSVSIPLQRLQDYWHMPTVCSSIAEQKTNAAAGYIYIVTSTYSLSEYYITDVKKPCVYTLQSMIKLFQSWIASRYNVMVMYNFMAIC